MMKIRLVGRICGWFDGQWAREASSRPDHLKRDAVLAAVKAWPGNAAPDARPGDGQP
jgi:hypothetical protein